MAGAVTQPRQEPLASVLIAQYDPDVLVYCEDREDVIEIARKQHRSSSRFSAASLFDHALQGAGIPVISVIEDVIERELKFQRVRTLSICLPEFVEEAAGIGAFLYGSVTDDDRHALESWLGPFAPIERPVLDLANLLTYFRPSSLSMGDLSCYGVKAPAGTVTFCLVDHDSSEDLQHLWNLRAAGDRVIPCPRSMLGNTSFLAHAWDVASRLQEEPHTFVVETSPRLEHCHQRFIEYVSSSTVPRTIAWRELGKRSPRDAAKFAAISISRDARTVDLDDDTSYVTMDCLSDGLPHGGIGTRRFINVVKFATTSSGWPTEVIPSGTRPIARSELGFFRYRATAAGLVYECRGPWSTISLPIPDNVVVIKSFLAEKSIRSDISDKGAMLNQFVLKATGLLMASVFTSGPHMELLQRARADGTISLISSPAPEAEERAALLRSLAASDLVSLGIRVKCAACARNQWFGLSNLDDIVSCPFCQSSIKLAVAEPSTLRWAYKVRGALANVDSRNDIAASVSAARYLDEFDVFISSTIAPAMVLEFDDGTQYEVDLIALVADIPRNGRPSVVFAECKSSTRFEARDFDRLRYIGSRIPGAFLMLATNRERFYGGEKKRIIDLARDIGPNRVIPVTINEIAVNSSLGSGESMARTLSELAAEMYSRNITAVRYLAP